MSLQPLRCEQPNCLSYLQCHQINTLLRYLPCGKSFTGCPRQTFHERPARDSSRLLHKLSRSASLHLGVDHPLQDVALRQCPPPSSILQDVALRQCPPPSSILQDVALRQCPPPSSILQDVALRQCPPPSSIQSCPASGSSLLLCDVILLFFV